MAKLSRLGGIYPCANPKQLNKWYANLTGVPVAITNPKGIGKTFMQNLKWFKNVETIEQLRKLWRKLAFQHHPDRGGDTRTMQEINDEYDRVSARLIMGNADFSDNRKKYEAEASGIIREIIEKIIQLDGITIEIIGSWIWVTGETRRWKEQLKAAGFKFSRSKIAWYWHHGTYRKNNGRIFQMDDIRSMWGAQTVSSNPKDEKDTPKSKQLIEF